MILRVLVIIFVLLLQEVFAQVSVQNILNKVSLDSLLQNVRDLSGVNSVRVNGTQMTITSRHKNQPTNNIAAEYIKQRLTEYGIPAMIQSFSTTGGNVIGTQTGTRYPNKKIMICAHFDDMPSGATGPGADDNASGTAAVIEAARIFSQSSFPYTILYALWDEEEQGLVGSAYYANQAAAAGDSILAVVNLDMIAYESNGDNVANIHTKSVAQAVALANKMVELNTQYGIGISPMVINPGISASDHASFWNKNYSAILLIEDDDNDFNAYYHTVNDKITVFNNPYFLKMAKLSLATVAYYALNLSLNIEHTPITSNSYYQGLETTARIYSGNSIGAGASAPRMYYRIANPANPVPFSFVSGVLTAPESYRFTIPSIPNGHKIEYYLAAQDSAGLIGITLPAGGGGNNPPGTTAPAKLYSFYTASPSLHFQDSLNVMAKWTANGAWAAVSNKFVSPPNSWNESPGGAYGNNAVYTLTTQENFRVPIPLSGNAVVYLSYDAQWDIEDKYDYCQIQLSTDNGATWVALQGQYTTPGSNNQPAGQPLYDGTQSAWVKEFIPISPQYLAWSMKFRFYIKTDASMTFDGFYFDNFVLGAYYLVPVELSSFTGSSEEGKIQLQWQTTSELNNKEFEVQKLVNNTWKAIGIVPGAGTTTELQRYSYTDQVTISGEYTYRLVQKDFSGAVHPSEPITVSAQVQPGEYSLYPNYPNPFNPVTTIEYSLPVASEVRLKVFDLFGREVSTLVQRKQEAGKHSVAFNAGELASGIYLYELNAGGIVLRKKMNLLK